MRTTQGERTVLYHAVSSYQLLEAILHRLRCHPGERAALVLPDFITEKYPQYGKLRERGFFQEVSLFPYLRLPHQSRDQVYRDALRLCRETLPRPLSRYEKIYVAGAHFYFSLALLQEGSPSPCWRTRRGCWPGAGSSTRTWRSATPSTERSPGRPGCSPGKTLSSGR